MVTVGHTGMNQADITDNIVALGKQLSRCIPGGINNIKQVLVKTKSAASIPIYMSSGGPQDVMLPKEDKPEDEIELEEVSTVMDGKVKVYPDGRVLVIKDGETEEEALKRGRMHSSQKQQRKRKKPENKQPKSKKQRKTKSAK